ncbi:MAG: nuclear transport factor 2 family protein [Armatimonadota bacterium]
MKTKFLLVGLMIIASSLSFAEGVPKVIQTRYVALQKAMSALNTKAFADFFAPDFIVVDPSGKPTKRDDFLGQVVPMIKNSMKAEPVMKHLGSTTRSGIVDVKFDFILKLTGKNGTTTIHEVGVDSWKLVGRKWLMVKTVQTKFDVKAGK